MKRVAVVVMMLMYLGCAPLADEDYDSRSAVEDLDPELGATTQAAIVKPWIMGEDFFGNDAVRVSDIAKGYTPSWWSLTMSSGSTEYDIHGTYKSGDNTRLTIGNTTWAMKFAGSTNGCAQNGCTFTLCMENLTRGGGWCSAVIPQGGVSSTTMLFFGNSSTFTGKYIYPNDWIRWHMYINTFSYWPWPVTVTEFAVQSVVNP